MLKQIYNLAVKILLLIGGLLSFIAIAQLITLGLQIHRISPVAGITYAAVLVGVFTIGSAAIIIRIRRLPRVLRAPLLGPLEQESHHGLLRYVRYLEKYLQRLAENPHVPETSRQSALDQAEIIHSTLANHPIRDDLLHLITTSRNETICPILDGLRDQARREVRTCVRDVMLGVTLIPYQGIDFIIVLYRNGAMILNVATIFASRPAIGEQFLILRDVLKVIATVNFINVGRNLVESLFAHVPVLGRYVDDIGQGLGAGILTSAAGQAAIERCAAFEGWNQQEAAKSIAGKMKTFLVDVRDIFTKDVLPGMRGRIRNEITQNDEEEPPGFWSGLNLAIGTAMDTSVGAVELLVVKPALAGTLKVADAGVAVKDGVSKAGQNVAEATRKTSSATRTGLSKIYRLLGRHS